MLLYLYGNLMEKLNTSLLLYNLLDNCASFILMCRCKNLLHCHLHLLFLTLILLNRFPWKGCQILCYLSPKSDHLWICIHAQIFLHNDDQYMSFCLCNKTCHEWGRIWTHWITNNLPKILRTNFKKAVFNKIFAVYLREVKE